MIRGEKTIEPGISFDLEAIAPRERMLFFDIETTGLSAGKSHIYLIGMLHFDGEAWKLLQYFAEDPLEEEQLLEAFFALVREKKKNGRLFLISYNGDGFDLPFIKKCVSQYRLPWDLGGIVSLDLLKKFRPYRRLAGLSDCKLKTVEKLCGIEREDKFSGAELIEVYREYLRLKHIPEGFLDDNAYNRALADKLLYTLLLHNAEDVTAMPPLLSVMAYELMFRGGLSVEAPEELHAGGKHLLDLKARLPMPLPSEYEYEDEHYVLYAGGDRLELVVTLYEGELRYFFDDYKNYYYLPEEDYAIHKSVGSFVAPSARRQATASSCYQKKQGIFLPEKEALFTPVFYRSTKNGEKYAAYEAGMLQDEADAGRYLRSVLCALTGVSAPH